MSKLNVDQQTIRELLGKRRNEFLIPDYQRPYAWTEEQCQTLWDDLYAFAIPDDDYSQFHDTDEYFLGSIVTFKNDDGQLEVIDGQQRLTTLLLLFRALYNSYQVNQEANAKTIKAYLEQCIWKTDEFDNKQEDQLKINSEVATDDAKEEFLRILKTGEVNKDDDSQYAKNYKFFIEKIDNLKQNNPACFDYLTQRILNNCILLPIEAESQDTALRIFSTLNDRGLPLSDADIFKAQFYKYYGDKGEKQDFIDTWKQLEQTANDIFHPTTGMTPMDDLFARYMYYLRAKEGNRDTTTESLRRFYSKDKFARLRNDKAINDLSSLVSLWQNVAEQNNDYFTSDVLRQLFILDNAPNGMWQYLLSVYFLTNRDSNNELDNGDLYRFLNKTIAFVWTYALQRPGVNALRTPIYDEMVNIVNGQFNNFQKYRFDQAQLRSIMGTFEFTNQRSITRSILTWYAFTFDGQVTPNLNVRFDIEHIYSRQRQKMEHGLSNDKLLDSLGNKILLEQSINIKASDYHFVDKKKFYMGEMRRRGDRKPSAIAELRYIVKLPDFTEQTIIEREQRIVNRFIAYLANEHLLQ